MSIKVTLEEATENLDTFCKQIAETDEVVFINRPDGKNVVLISQSELESLLETLYLLRSPKNSARLLNALQRAKAKIVQPQEVSALYEKFGLSEDNTDNDIAAAS